MELNHKRVAQWQPNRGQHWVVVVYQRANSATLVQQLCGEAQALNVFAAPLLGKVAVVSLAEQQKLLAAELAKDNSNFQQGVDYGTCVEQLIAEQGASQAEVKRLLTKADLLHLRHSGVRQLSTGEMRRLLIARSLALKPDWLILDDAYAGLDHAHRSALSLWLSELTPSISCIMLTSKPNDLPDFITHILLLDEQGNGQTMTKAQWQTHPIVTQLNALSEQASQRIAQLWAQSAQPVTYTDPLISMNNVKVEYCDRLIFSGLTWQVKQGEHWQIRGPNGCGKSTLLGLILGDHPQCYANDIQLFGFQRGTGESIWQVKQHIGVVSAALHESYRVACSTLEVVLSGFYDSIGLYQSPTRQQIKWAELWLAAVGMTSLATHPFVRLEYGQQRLVLILRALIKCPPLLILDEAYQGLDVLNRQLVFQALEQIANSQISQLLYVTHYEDERLSAIQHFLDFVPAKQGGYQVVISSTAALDKA